MFNLKSFTPKLLGTIGVDSGQIVIGDPCYYTGKGKAGDLVKMQAARFEGDKHTPFTSFPFKLGHEGLGVITSTEYGDGSYNVIGFFNKTTGNTRPTFVIVDFGDVFADLVE